LVEISKSIVDETPSLVESLPKFDIRQVRAFLLLTEELHFGRAAARLCTSQSALSVTIQALEEGVGLRLLERSTRRVRLTPAGEVFAAEARQAFGHLLRAAAYAHTLATEPGNLLRVGYNDFSITGLMPALLNRFSAEFPEVTLDLRFLPSPVQRTALQQGSLDVGLMIDAFTAPGSANHLIERNEYVALLPTDHPLARRKSLRLADLADEPFVLGEEKAYGAFRKALFGLCEARGFHPRVKLSAPSTVGILGMVAAGVGVSVFGSCARNINRADVVVKSLSDVSETIPIYASGLAANPSPAVQRFTQFISQHT
jgi:DNA-binding transcriptional LysR family regulator